LQKPLDQKEYCLTFFLSKADSNKIKMATSNIGGYVSEIQPQDGNGDTLSVSPQYEYTGPPITNESEWVRLSGSVQASGGEAYLTIGNFRSDGNTDYINQDPSQSNNKAYYYIDNISLTPVQPQFDHNYITLGQGDTVRLSSTTDTISDHQWTPSSGLINDTVSDPLAHPDTSTTYTVTKRTHCDTTTAQVTVHVTEPPPSEDRLYIPNVFAPSAQGDAENRKFRVHGGPFKGYHLQVFSRWGELVFEAKDPNKAWKGRFDGKPVKGGVYSYQFRGVLEDGVEVERSGTVTLLR
jgi:gliding motility-associated-like protein